MFCCCCFYFYFVGSILGGAEEESKDASGESTVKTSRNDSKTDSKTDSSKWEWQSDSGWTDFGRTSSRAIEKAFRQKKAELEIKVLIDFFLAAVGYSGGCDKVIVITTPINCLASFMYG